METILIPAVRSRSRQTMFPLLVALFLISYVLLTTLVVLQNRTIDAQRGLIHLLFKDNLHLSATKLGLRGNQVARSNQATASATALSHNPSTQIQANQTPSTQAQSNQAQSKQTPSNQVSATQTPSVQVPVIQATPQASAKSGQSSRKAQKALPAFPPAEVTDPSDMRRVSISI
jgi:hypothetical protein